MMTIDFISKIVDLESVIGVAYTKNYVGIYMTMAQMSYYDEKSILYHNIIT